MHGYNVHEARYRNYKIYRLMGMGSGPRVGPIKPCSKMKNQSQKIFFTSPIYIFEKN